MLRMRRGRPECADESIVNCRAEGRRVQSVGPRVERATESRDRKFSARVSGQGRNTREAKCFRSGAEPRAERAQG